MLDERARAQPHQPPSHYPAVIYVPHPGHPPYPHHPEPRPVDPDSRLGRRRRRARLARRAVPVIAALLVGVVTADLMLLAELTGREQDGTSQVAPDPSQARRVSSGYVADSGQNAQTAAPVAPLGKLRVPHLFAVSRQAFTQRDLEKAAKVRGVAALEIADAAEVSLDGKRVQTLGVDPSTFRAFTPKPTAGSDALWRNVAAGDVAVSFVLGNDGGLTLGRTVPGSGGRTLRVGAYATMGMGSIDAVVSRQTARALGMPQNNALVVSAPKADTAKLRARLLRALPKGTQIIAINPVLTAPRRQADTPGTGNTGSTGGTGDQAATTVREWPAGSLMTAEQIQAMLTAAASKVGRPYVWGAEGPDSFDCSGLVQWAFAQAGVRMPRVTHQQWVTGPQVPLDQAQPGDLLFWRSDPTNPGYISHVAIYWGDGKMLHAPRTGDVVKIAPIYTRNLAGVVRVSPQVAAGV
ncbi:cell wall-associated NlpC family hydrolase [Thermocatellispora tengchongensis]|uniref:Cell wall-associated NlpC family hydrolase n=1 Tax=Thermocatellispora tengchongensis TaxID=1073253 RepID=A0A840P9G1_9ACTN|nr:C40 family peptidase [Thermocatellispora tengchongensis]MBB5134070.1 cell wall-associated NlpC family hydrolase [Thermocatellispora tengchongensis]